MLFLCVSVYCHRVTTQLQLINIIIIIIIIVNYIIIPRDTSFILNQTKGNGWALQHDWGKCG